MACGNFVKAGEITLPQPTIDHNATVAIMAQALFAIANEVDLDKMAFEAAAGGETPGRGAEFARSLLGNHGERLVAERMLVMGRESLFGASGSGIQGLDLVTVDSKTGHVHVTEVKTTASASATAPKMSQTKDHGVQMSDQWLGNHLADLFGADLAPANVVREAILVNAPAGTISWHTVDADGSVGAFVPRRQDRYVGMSARRPRGRSRAISQPARPKRERRTGPTITRLGPVHPRAIALFERRFGVELPSDYRSFLERDGALVGRVHLLGLLRADEQPATIYEATTAVRQAGLRAGLIPIEDFGAARYACLDCDASSQTAGRVVLIDLDRLGNETVAAESFADYERTARNDAFAIAQVERRARRSNPTKLPRSHHWRALRLCTQNVVVGLLELRHNRDEGLLEIGAFASDDRPEFRPLESTRALTLMLLSEAFKCGGSMALRFLYGGREPSRLLPPSLQRLLRAHGFDVPTVGALSPDEAVALYLALTDFSDGVRAELTELLDVAPLEVARACYVVNAGIWSSAEFDVILAAAPDADRLLGGAALTAPFAVLEQDVRVARRALLAGRLDRSLAAAASLGRDGVSTEDDVATLPRKVVDGGASLRYELEHEIVVPWAWPAAGAAAAGGTVDVFLRPWDLEQMVAGLGAEIEAIGRAAGAGKPWLVVPRDATTAPRRAREHWAGAAQASGVGIALATDFVITLDSEALRRLEHSRLVRS